MTAENLADFGMHPKEDNMAEKKRTVCAPQYGIVPGRQRRDTTPWQVRDGSAAKTITTPRLGGEPRGSSGRIVPQHPVEIATGQKGKPRFEYPRDLVLPDDPRPPAVPERQPRSEVTVVVRKSRKIGLSDR